MKIGVFVFLTEHSLDPALLARRAEDLGFESFWVPEHPAVPVKTSLPFPRSPSGTTSDSYARIVDPFVALARASSVTSTIMLGTGICLVPERNPLLLAKEVATLDRLSGGKFIFGIGAGWLPEGSAILGSDSPHRWTQTREAVLAMKELWMKDEAEFHGGYYDFPRVRSFPKPGQAPHPPVILGGDSPNVFKRAAEWGDGWVAPIDSPMDRIRDGCAQLRRLAESNGRDPKGLGGHRLRPFGPVPGPPRSRRA